MNELKKLKVLKNNEYKAIKFLTDNYHEMIFYMLVKLTHDYEKACSIENYVYKDILKKCNYEDDVLKQLVIEDTINVYNILYEGLGNKEVLKISDVINKEYYFSNEERIILNSLDEQDSKIFFLKTIFAFTFDEISKELSIDKKEIITRYKEAIKKVKEINKW